MTFRVHFITNYHAESFHCLVTVFHKVCGPRHYFFWVALVLVLELTLIVVQAHG